ncbi:Protease-associated RING/U-box zinc finger family protein [Perilla frutescens var. frutescens]|nr:Protease-associated RING/U-box zinc finger family protein [Perilla frutescens var. frutescens]
MQLWIVPSYENPSWSIIALSFISLLGVSAVLATCFFVRRHRFRIERPLGPRVREFHGISSRLVKAMPSLIFTDVLEDNCTSQTCAKGLGFVCLVSLQESKSGQALPYLVSTLLGS